MQIETLFLLIVLILSVVIHEVTHGYVAEKLGDPTARLAGRLTLNPLKHVDPLGSVILPGLMLLSNASFVFGWAKPVPYNPYNLRGRFGEAFVAGSGPLANIVIAVVFGLLIRFAGDTLSPAFVSLSTGVVILNLLLAVVNLIPVPPLDGSKVLAALLPHPLSVTYDRFRFAMERNFIAALALVFLALFLLQPLMNIIVFPLVRLLTGL
jgi:Zn-dependent protease